MVALIFCGDLKYCPYLKRYIERLDKLGIPYSVLFWNRGGYDLDLPENYYHYDNSSDLNSGKIKKILDFFLFKQWVEKKLKELSPNKIVALSTLTGVLLGAKLYKGKTPYAFDIRDYSYEHVYPFYHIEKKVIQNSTFTAISSKGFESFLPKSDYVIAHNFNRNDLPSAGAKWNKKASPLCFVWNGVVRYFDHQKQYLDALKNDSRFVIVFHGDGPQLDKYREYCEKNQFENVVFTGSYKNEDKAVLLKNAAILNNSYGYSTNAGNKLKYAISNRFYDGMIYHIPQIVEPEGYKTRWAKESGIGEAFDADITFADRLYAFYENLDGEAFDKACDELTETVLAEDDEYISKIDSFFAK